MALHTRRAPARVARRAACSATTAADVDNLLDDIADSYEDVWRERADLADKRRALERSSRELKELEELLRTTLVSAERAAERVRRSRRRRGRADRRRGPRRGAVDHPRRPGRARAAVRRGAARRDAAASALGMVEESQARSEAARADAETDRARGARVQPSARRRAQRARPPEPSRASRRGPTALPGATLGAIDGRRARSTARRAREFAGRRRRRRPPRRRLEGARRRRARARQGERGRRASCSPTTLALPRGERRDRLGPLARDKMVELDGHRPRTRPSGGSQASAAGKDAAVSTHRHRRVPHAARASAARDRSASSTSTRRTPARSRTSRRGRRSGSDNHLGDTATATFDRELDYGLEEDAQQTLDADRRALAADRRRDVRDLRALRQADRRGAARSHPVGDALHRRPAARPSAA